MQVLRLEKNQDKNSMGGQKMRMDVNDIFALYGLFNSYSSHFIRDNSWMGSGSPVNQIAG